MNKLVRLLVVPVLPIKTRPIFKLLGVSAALVAITLLWSFKAPPVSAVPESDHDQDQSKVQIGFDIAPVPLNLEGKNRHLVGLGSYIVNAQSDCNGCHSRGPSTEYIGPGNPYLLSPPHGPFTGQVQVNPATYLGGGRDFGPFGSKLELTHLYSRNLTPDKTGLPEGGHTFEEFLTIMRTGKDFDHVHPNCTGALLMAPDGKCLLPPFNGEVLQVMPWPVHQNMTEHDLRAIYEYLSAIPCIDTDIPDAPGLRNDCK
ncbi:MAG TPA: hypothetical protein VKB47_08435 [Terracidiphilus sp.]|nr:hypothetical protein [Terracidiphilus sp.]